ncbi:winged helix DNA-binding domain-containing protein [soil metagenome]
MIEVTVKQALAFRLAGNNLTRRVDPMVAVAACGIQEYPPGWGQVAIHARTTGEPSARSTVLINAMRGAPHFVPVKERSIFTAALVPNDPEQLRALIGSAAAKHFDKAKVSVADGLERIEAAARDGLADGPLSFDDFHQALRERLPKKLLPWCEPCQSHHVKHSVWQALGPLGVTMMPGRGELALVKASAMPLSKARSELARRFLRCFGPATHSQLASWGGTSPAHAKALLGAIADETCEVRLGSRKALVLESDEKRLVKPPKAKGVRLLGGHDPWVAQPDRDSLVPDKALRKRMFPALARPGVVLVDGQIRGLWKARKKGETLRIELDWIGPKADVEREARAVAKRRGAKDVALA